MLVEITGKRAAIIIGSILIIAVLIAGLNASDLRAVNDFKHSTGIGAVTVDQYGMDAQGHTLTHSAYVLIPGRDSVTVHPPNEIYQKGIVVAYQFVVRP
jgi:hypothetical protein